MNGLAYYNAAIHDIILMFFKYWCKIDALSLHIHLSIMPDSHSATKKSAAAVHDDNNEVSNDDFNIMMTRN